MARPSPPARRGGLLSRLFRKPEAKPLAELERQLATLGAQPLPSETVARSTEPTVLAHVEGSSAGETDLLALALTVVSPAGDTRFQLRGRDGAVIDEFVAGEGQSDAVLFMPPGRAVLVARTPQGRRAAATLEAVSLFAFAHGAATPAKLAQVGDLKRPFDWSEAYLPPRTGDVGGRLRARLFRDMSSAHAIPTVAGKQVLLEPGDELSRAVFVTGYYEPESMAAISQILPKGGVFVDVGAHCGMFTLLASELVGPQGTVLAFEPSRREYDRLIANIELNRLANVLPFNAAVSEAAGEARLLIAEPGHSGHNTTSRRFTWDVRPVQTVDTPAVTLDSVFLAQGLSRCDVIKTDIEGGTLQMLKGAAGLLAKHRPTLVLEIFEKAMAANETTIAALAGWLDDHGYELRDLDPRTGKIKAAWTNEPEVSKNVIALPKR